MTIQSRQWTYVDLMDDKEGGLSAPFPTPSSRIPTRVTVVRVSGERFLEFEYRDIDVRRTRLSRKMLAPFLEIAHMESDDNWVGDPRRALAFAERFGALGICVAHNRSCWHVIPACPSAFKRADGCTFIRERLEPWYVYSLLARDILNLKANPGKLDPTVDLKRLRQFFGSRVSSAATAINQWLSECRIAVQITGEKPRLQMAPLPMGIGQLGIQLALVVTESKGLFVCAACGALVRCDRQPRFDRASYCETCGRRAAVCAASRRYRKNKNEAFKLFTEGVNNRDIARRLGLKLTSVENWRNRTKARSHERL